MHSCSIPQPTPDRAAELARLAFLARKVGLVHGPGHPDMVELATIVARLAEHPATAIAPADRAALQRLTASYTPWAEACNSVRSLFQGLATITDNPTEAA